MFSAEDTGFREVRRYSDRFYGVRYDNTLTEVKVVGEAPNYSIQLRVLDQSNFNNLKVFYTEFVPEQDLSVIDSLLFQVEQYHIFGA